MAAQELRHKVRDVSVRMWRGGEGAALVYLHGAAGVPGSQVEVFDAWASLLSPDQTPRQLPVAATPLLGAILETLLGFTLIIGLQTRLAALASGILLLIFALAMTISMGIKSALNYSVFSASAGAFWLAQSPLYPWTLDALLHRDL